MQQPNGKGFKEFFATMESDDLARELMNKVDTWQSLMKSSLLWKRMQKSHRTYYGMTRNWTDAVSEVKRGGEREELALLTVNHYRNLLQHLLVLTTSQRPAMECRAVNMDYDSQVQCQLGNGLIDYYLREKRLEKYLKKAVEQALVYSEGYIGMKWDTSAGEMYGVDPQTQRPMFQGDIIYSNISPLDVIRDPVKRNAEWDWVIVVDYKNKFDLASKYPDLSDRLIALSDDKQLLLRNSFLGLSLRESDEVPVYTFYHRKSEALPQGRVMEFFGSDLWTIDGALPYKNIPVYRISPADQHETPYGYTPGFDLLGLQQALNTCHSTILTNISAFGVQNIQGPPGAGIDVRSLSDGMNYIETNSELKPLALCATPPEVYKYTQMIEGQMETISAVNSVVRGNPPDSVKSGSFAALVASQSIQFNSGLQQSYAQLLEDVGMGTIEMLQTYANTDRVATIVGKNNRTKTETFKGKDVASISRVIVDMANPITRTTEGRMEIANQLLQTGLIKRPEQYFTVLSTGKLDPMYDVEYQETMAIEAENEALQEMKPLRSLPIDMHVLHIQEHKKLLGTPEARSNPQLVKAVLAHIQEHIQNLRQTDPGLLMVLGQQPLPPLPPPPPPPGMMPPPPPQGPGGPPPPPPPHGHGGHPHPAPKMPLLNQQGPGPGAADMPKQPGMPENPLTGQKFNPVTGGM